jgi:hypothetical protein
MQEYAPVCEHLSTVPDKKNTGTPENMPVYYLYGFGIANSWQYNAA